MLAAPVTVAGQSVIPLSIVHPTKSEVKNTVSWIGGTTITVALFMLLFALTEGNVVGWRRPYMGAIIAVSVILIILFVLWQL